MKHLLQYMLTPDGRRAIALLFLAAGGAVMTAYALTALIMVRKVSQYAFYLGLAAHVSILVVLTGFAGLLVKRMLKANIAGASFEADDRSDDAIHSGDQVTVSKDGQ